MLLVISDSISSSYVTVTVLYFVMCYVLIVALADVNRDSRYSDVLFYFKFGDSALSVMMQQTYTGKSVLNGQPWETRKRLL